MTPVDDRQRLRFILATIALVAGTNLWGALTHAGPRFALLSTAFTCSLLLGWTILRRDPVLARWLAIGQVAGWIEIATDAWLVAETGTLQYPPGEPMVWDSPLYMPFAWTIVLAQIGVVGGWLLQRQGLLRATALTALIGGSSIPLYELLAHHAGYWTYVNTPMVCHAPLYIIASEFLLSLPLVWIHRQAQARRWPWSLGLGALAGLWMLPSVWFAWKLVGPCQGAWLPVGCG